jgi:hypothetical protein
MLRITWGVGDLNEHLDPFVNILGAVAMAVAYLPAMNSCSGILLLDVFSTNRETDFRLCTRLLAKRREMVARMV